MHPSHPGYANLNRVPSRTSLNIPSHPSISHPPSHVLKPSVSGYCVRLTCMTTTPKGLGPRHEVVAPCARPVARFLCPKLVRIQAPIACLAAALVVLGKPQGLHRPTATCAACLRSQVQREKKRESAVCNLCAILPISLVRYLQFLLLIHLEFKCWLLDRTLSTNDILHTCLLNRVPLELGFYELLAVGTSICTSLSVKIVNECLLLNAIFDYLIGTCGMSLGPVIASTYR